MHTLTALQSRVAAAIRQGDDALADTIGATARLARAVRLGIYADAYLLRLDEALRSNYPKLHLLLGDADFLALTRAYLAGQPSQRPNIRWFGHALPAWLASTAPYAAIPALAELARFEWALGLAFDAADATPLPLAALTEVADEAWDSVRLVLHPSVSLLTLGWNAPAIWRALDAGEAPAEPTADRRSWAVWREALQPHYRSLAEDEAALLNALQAGQPFGPACAVLLAWHSEENAPARAGALLGQWLNDGWISGLADS